MTNTKPTIPAFVAFIPFIVLIIMLIGVIKIFGSDALEGASQITLLVATAVCVGLAMLFYKIPWATLEESLIKNISNISSAVIMLLLIGSISGTWMLSGVVPSMIYYGLQIMHPKIFLFACCIISALVALVIGSSWTTIATIGIALVGIGQSQGFEPHWIAGAIISGAYFGDKISPLSDTTILSSSSAGTPLFTHIRYMLITTVPSFIITIIIFLIVGFSHNVSSQEEITEFSSALQTSFNISPWLFIVPILTGVLIFLKLPALITLFLATLFAVVALIIAQPQIIEFVSGADTLTFSGIFSTALKSCYGSVVMETPNELLNSLIATRGMAGMLNTIWLILTAACFGGVMLGSGMINSITSIIIKYLKRCVSTVASTIFTGVFCNIFLADQYLSIILTSNLFKNFYDKKGYEPRLLSRSVEDSATITSVLIPWNSCGMTQATVLNVATLSYLPYCFFNLISPIMSIIVAATGYKIVKPKKT